MAGAQSTPGEVRGSRIFGVLAVFASAFWLHYYLVQDMLGPLNVDELYFAHIFWLQREGLQQYSDFYSAHLPTYFWLLGPLVPRAPPTDLSFVWNLRAASFAVALVYPLLLFKLCRRDFLYLLPFLLFFIVFARMTEIRTDTIGLVLFNAAWFWLLRGSGRNNILLAAAFSGLALFFSARAAVMMAGMAAVLVALCLRRKDLRALIHLAFLGAGFLAFVGLIYLFDPARFAVMVHSVYLEPSSVMPDVSLAQRVVPLDRFWLLFLVLAALVGAVLELARDRTHQAAVVIAGACATQILLALIDPSPFQYVYGWSVIPTLAGLALLGKNSARRLHAGLALGSAALAAPLFAAGIAYLVVKGHPPLTSSVTRITYDPPIPTERFVGATTPQILTMMVTTNGQQGLWNQLALLSEICRRIEGPVLTRFVASPLCLHDARYEWTGLKWPPMFEGEAGNARKAEFEALIARRPPELVAWGKRLHVPRLNPWGRALLKDYEIHDGFALHRTAVLREVRTRRLNR